MLALVGGALRNSEVFLYNLRGDVKEISAFTSYCPAGRDSGLQSPLRNIKDDALLKAPSQYIQSPWE